MGQVEHRVFATRVSRRHTKVSKSVTRSRTKCGIPKSPLRLRPRWVVRGGDLPQHKVCVAEVFSPRPGL